MARLIERVGPFDVAQQPRASRSAVSWLAGRRIDQHRGVGMLAARYDAGTRGETGPSTASRMMPRLVLAERHQQHLAGVEDRAQAHRDGLRRHVLFAEEIAGGARRVTGSSVHSRVRLLRAAETAR